LHKYWKFILGVTLEMLQKYCGFFTQPDPKARELHEKIRKIIENI
jgi:hypothetical protein